MLIKFTLSPSPDNVMIPCDLFRKQAVLLQVFKGLSPTQRDVRLSSTPQVVSVGGRGRVLHRGTLRSCRYYLSYV